MLKCPVCESKNYSVFLNRVLPVYNLKTHRTREEALNAKKGRVESCFCHNCHFIFNKSFDSNLMDYSVNYEASRSHSTYFQNYLRSVCFELNDLYEIYDKNVVEVGAGDGEFLKMLRHHFEFTGYGFDASWKITGVPENYEDIQWVAGIFDFNSNHHNVDLVIL